MKPSRLLACAALALVVRFAAATEAPGEGLELAPGVRYLAPTAVPAAPPNGSEGLVLDLRLPAAEGFESLAARLKIWVAATGPVRIVLLSAQTAPAWSAALERRAANVLTLAPSGVDPAPDITVDLAADQVEILARLATAGGADLARLALPPVEKRRFDEAALVQRHQGTNSERNRTAPSAPPPEAPAEPESAAGPEVPSTAETPPAPTSDPMLMRAVQVAQGLRALRRG